MEVSVSGYVKGDFIYDTHNNIGRSANADAIAIGGAGAASQLPDLTAAMQYNGPGGILVHLSGILRELHVDQNAPGGVTTDSELGYGFNTAVDLPLGDLFTLYGSFTYGDDLGRYLLNSGNRAGVINAAGNIDTTEIYGITAGGSFKLSEASSLNGNWRYERHGNNLASADTRSLMTVHATYLWQPVSKLRMGL